MIVFKLLNWLCLLCTTAHLFEWIGGEYSFLSDFWQLLCFKFVIIYLWCVYFFICFMCAPLYCSAKDILIFYVPSIHWFAPLFNLWRWPFFTCQKVYHIVPSFVVVFPVIIAFSAFAGSLRGNHFWLSLFGWNFGRRCYKSCRYSWCYTQ